MEYEETVVSERQLKDKLGNDIVVGQQARKSLEFQAEISYKAGMLKVVEWVKRTYIRPLTKTAGLIQVRNLEVDLEAKLKDWGL